MKEKYWVLDCERIEPKTRSIINDYLSSLKDQKRAAATIDKYRRIIEQFFIETMKSSLEELASSDVLDWLDKYCKNRSKRTVRLYLTVLSSLFKFCLAKNHIDKILTKRRWFPEIPYSVPRHLNGAEVARLKIAAEKFSIRDRAIIAFMLSSGVRRKEASGLNIENVDLKERVAQVKGKGDKTRIVHFSVECALLLKRYLAKNPRDEGPMFLNRYGDRISDARIYEIVARLKREADLPPYFCPHSLRSTFACLMLSRGAELGFITDELGHVNMDTTRVYARILTEDLISEYKQKMG